MNDYTGTDIYCDLIIPNKIDVKVVKETKNFLAFYHTKPYWPVHIVVTPKLHIASLLYVPDELERELLAIVKQIARIVNDNEGACRIITNLGNYQDSKQLHIHISSGQHLD